MIDEFNTSLKWCALSEYVCFEGFTPCGLLVYSRSLVPSGQSSSLPVVAEPSNPRELLKLRPRTSVNASLNTGHLAKL